MTGAGGSAQQHQLDSTGRGPTGGPHIALNLFLYPLAHGLLEAQPAQGAARWAMARVEQLLAAGVQVT